MGIYFGVLDGSSQDVRMSDKRKRPICGEDGADIRFSIYNERLVVPGLLFA